MLELTLIRLLLIKFFFFYRPTDRQTDQQTDRQTIGIIEAPVSDLSLNVSLLSIVFLYGPTDRQTDRQRNVWDYRSSCAGSVPLIH